MGIFLKADPAAFSPVSFSSIRGSRDRQARPNTRECLPGGSRYQLPGKLAACRK